MVISSEPATKKARINFPADEQLGALGNCNIAAARTKLNELFDEHPHYVWQILEMVQNGTINKI
eukprot:11749243-Prorocentrum_lima.AAC.1